MKIIKSLFILFFLILISCSDSGTEAKGSHTVSGVLIYQDSFLGDVIVSIDNKLNLSATSDDNGNFLIENVTTGDHKIVFEKTFEDGSFIDMSNDINVTDDVILEQVRLPKTIFLYDPITVTDDSVHLPGHRPMQIIFRNIVYIDIQVRV